MAEHTTLEQRNETAKLNHSIWLEQQKLGADLDLEMENARNKGKVELETVLLEKAKASAEQDAAHNAVVLEALAIFKGMADTIFKMDITDNDKAALLGKFLDDPSDKWRSAVASTK